MFIEYTSPTGFKFTILIQQTNQQQYVKEGEVGITNGNKTINHHCVKYIFCIKVTFSVLYIKLQFLNHLMSSVLMVCYQQFSSFIEINQMRMGEQTKA